MAIRKYALCVLDSADTIIDRYNLDITTDSAGNGFELDMSVLSSDVEDIITKVVQKKAQKTFSVIQGNDVYNKSNSLAYWIQKYSNADKRMCLEYDDTTAIKYCEGKVTLLTKGERDEYGVLKQQLTFTRTTPDFLKRENRITIYTSSYGKKYPYKYPYSYGSSTVQNNEIDNIYIADTPVIVSIFGVISNPRVKLNDESGASYNEVYFDGVALTAKEEIVINSAQRKIYKNTYNDNGKLVSTVDFSAEVSPAHDTFLRARPGKSSITINTEDVGAGFKLVGGWRQYTI